MTPEEIRNEKLSEKLITSLESRHFEAYYCATKNEAKEKILSLIPKTDVVSWGGSKTIEELGIIEELKKENISVIDRSTATTNEEKVELMRKALLCDTYLSSTNAITEDGELVNVDGNGNRTAAMMFGPKSVIVACSMNKVEKDIMCAVSRARNYVAPINAQRFEIKTPCKINGTCGDCKSPQSICTYVVRTRLSKPAKRIKIVLIGETLGF